MVRNIAGTAMALQPRTRQASVVSVERLKVYLTERQMSVRHRDDEQGAASSRYQRRAEVQEKPGWDVECRGSAQLAHYLVGIDQGTQGSNPKE